MIGSLKLLHYLCVTKANDMNTQPKKENEKADVCILCGSHDMDLKTDHLRECYKVSQDKLDAGTYRPVLFYDEMSRLQRGFNIICSNRSKCRKRQAGK